MPWFAGVAIGGSVSTPRQQGLLQQLARISVCQIADGVGSSIAIDTSIRPLDPSFHICARARTVVCAPDDNLTLHHALHIAEPGEALVVDGSGGDEAALWGELMSISAQARGLAGTVVDGPARDPLEIAALKYPVFARSVRPRRASKDSYGSVGEPIRCGGLSLSTGDVVVADCNGMIAFPYDQLPDVLEQALQVVQKETELKGKLRTGITIFDLAGLSSSVKTNGGRKGA